MFACVRLRVWLQGFREKSVGYSSSVPNAWKPHPQPIREPPRALWLFYPLTIITPGPCRSAVIGFLLLTATDFVHSGQPELREERLQGEGTPERFSGALVSQGKLGTSDYTCLRCSGSLTPRGLRVKQLLTKNDPSTLLKCFQLSPVQPVTPLG